MAQVRITELPESLTLDNNSVFPMVYNNVTQKITFKSLKDVMLYFEGVSYDEINGKFTFTRSNQTSSILSTNLYKSFKKAEIINSDIVFTDFANNTYTIDLLTEEIQEKLTEINNKIAANTKAIQKNATDIATNKSNITKNTNDIKKINDSKGVANGFAELDSNGQVPSSQLPAYVDDVIEGYLYNGNFYEDYSHTILISGESGKIYVDLVTEKTYRWTGTIFTVISETLALGETSSTAYRGDRGKIAYNHSQTTGNPHNTTKADIGLSNVDNTSDSNKIVKEANKTTNRLLIQQNGNSIATFDGSSAKTANIIVPTKTSQLTNDSDFINSQGTVAVADKIGTTTVGGSTTPVYINEGTPTPIGYSISKSVPADAIFTDTTYTNATQSKAGLMSATDKAKLDGVSNDADKVEWQQNVNTGVNIANVTINGTKTAIYAPTSSQYRGDMEKSVYDTNNDGIVDEAAKTTGTLTIQKNQVDIDSFNGSTNKTINISVPTSLDEFTTLDNNNKDTNSTLVYKKTNNQYYRMTIYEFINNFVKSATMLNNVNLNDIKILGFYYAPGANIIENKPANVDSFGLLIYRTAAGYIVQELTSGNNNPLKKYIRQFNALTWSDWTEMKYTDTTYSLATTTANGLMSKEDKTKLNSIATGATANSASTTTPKANGTASIGTETAFARGDHIHPAQTTISGNAGTATKLKSFVFNRSNNSNSWVKIATATVTKSYNETHAFLFIKGSHNSNYQQNGILAIDVLSGIDHNISSYQANFLIRTTELNPNDFYIEYKNEENNSIVNLWANARTQVYASWSCSVLYNNTWNILSTLEFQASVPSTGYTGKYATYNGQVLQSSQLANAKNINGTAFNGTNNITTANWGTARNIGIVNSDGTGTAVTTSVNGSANINLKLPSTIKASLSGNATSATKATQDSDGNQINTTYAKKTDIPSNLSGMPIGSGCDYYGQTAPEGFLFADGSAISRTEYAELFEIIGETFGVGDGETTFNLPDKRKRVTVMREENDTGFDILGKTGGSVNHTLTKAELPNYTLYNQNHAHSGVVTNVTASGSNTWDILKNMYSVTSVSKSTGNTANATIKVDSGGSGQAINIMNPYLVCNYIIKVK